jgi:hypothetical protein
MQARVVWRVIGAVVTVATILCGAATTGLWLARQTETRRHTYEPTGTSIAFDLPGIDVTVVTGEPGVLTVERRLTWVTTRPVVEEQWDGRALAVAADCRSLLIGPRCDVVYTLEVPPHADLVIGTGAGDLRVTGLVVRNLTIHTGLGDVRIDLAEPPERLEVETGSGDIEIAVPPSTQYLVDTDAEDPSIAVPQAPRATHVITVHTASGGLHVRPRDGG